MNLAGSISIPDALVFSISIILLYACERDNSPSGIGMIGVNVFTAVSIAMRFLYCSVSNSDAFFARRWRP